MAAQVMALRRLMSQVLPVDEWIRQAHELIKLNKSQ